MAYSSGPVSSAWPAGRAAGLLRPLQELPAAHSAVLRPDSLELGAAVAVGAVHRAAPDGVPVLAHILLPIFAVIHGVAEGEEQTTEASNRFSDGFLVFLGFDRWLRCAGSPRTATQHRPDFVGILGVILLEYHPSNSFL